MLAHAIGEFDAAQARHVDVDERDVGQFTADQREPVLAVGRFTDHLDAGLLREDHAEAGTHQLVIVDQNHSDHATPIASP